MSEPTDDDDKGGKVVRLDFRKAREEREQRAAPEDPWAAQKLQAFERLIDEGMVLVSLDSRRPGVSVPPHHRGDPQLGLNFSLRFYVDDFAYDDQGVRASLSFQGAPFFCDIPWSAVFMLRSHVTDEVFLFPASVPTELEGMLQHIEEQLEAQQETPGKPAGGAPIASLKEAGFGSGDGDPSPSDDNPDGNGPDDEGPQDDGPHDDGPHDDGGPGLKLIKG